MSKKIQGLLDLFQANNFPAMMETLALQLGVSADSLTRLGVGFAPCVEFKKGWNYDGWWVVAERDSDAEPVGLSLRHHSGSKVMYPGSNHGLIYEVNHNHVKGEKGFSPGPSNWIRTMDAGAVCPVCNKPDGCLLSAENPTSPKAVICIRVKEGAKQPMKMGYLHILKPEGDLKVASAVNDNGGPVVIVEGMSDTAAAMDLGFDGVGRPSDKACMHMLGDAIRGRRVIIVGENDKKADGREPGREGMVEAFQMLRKVCPDTVMIMPPAHVKDLRAWKVKYGLTREDFLDYVEKKGERIVSNEVILDDRPLTIARDFLRDCHKMGKRYVLRRWYENWYVYRGSKYEPISEEEYEQPIHPWSYSKKIQYENAKGDIRLVPMKADHSTISNMTRAVVSETLITDKNMPCWINGAEGRPYRDLVVFSNGILDISQYLAGSEDALLDLTPDLFTTAALPVSYDPTAKCPQWQAFLESSLGDDPQKIALLQEWMGYCITTDMSMQKMMFLRGVKRSGKGTIIRAMISLIGDGQSVTTDYLALTGAHAMYPLMGKLGCFLPDAEAQGTNIPHGLGVLLKITGCDAVQINQKNRDQIASYKLMCRITIASNEFPNFPDHAGAMEARLNIIDFQRSFAGREDYHLDDKLKSELSGIAVWALEGLRRLRAQERFTVPPSSVSALEAFRLNASPTASFVYELTDPTPGGWVLKSELADVWEQWSRGMGLKDVSRQRLMERIRMTAPYITEEVDEARGVGYSVVKGVTWKPWVHKKFLGRP